MVVAGSVITGDLPLILTKNMKFIIKYSDASVLVESPKASSISLKHPLFIDIRSSNVHCSFEDISIEGKDDSIFIHTSIHTVGVEIDCLKVKFLSNLSCLYQGLTTMHITTDKGIASKCVTVNGTAESSSFDYINALKNHIPWIVVLPNTQLNHEKATIDYTVAFGGAVKCATSSGYSLSINEKLYNFDEKSSSFLEDIELPTIFSNDDLHRYINISCTNPDDKVTIRYMRLLFEHSNLILLSPAHTGSVTIEKCIWIVHPFHAPVWVAPYGLFRDTSQLDHTVMLLKNRIILSHAFPIAISIGAMGQQGKYYVEGNHISEGAGLTYEKPGAFILLEDSSSKPFLEFIRFHDNVNQISSRYFFYDNGVVTSFLLNSGDLDKTYHTIPLNNISKWKIHFKGLSSYEEWKRENSGFRIQPEGIGIFSQSR